MAGFLFEQIIFGPIHSRRLGSSLGVNLLPLDRKYCNFNCIYCECGWTPEKNRAKGFPTARQVSEFLEKKLRSMKNAQLPLDSITFAGNGEPTLHPEFAEVVTHVLRLRDQFYADSLVSVLTNALQLTNKRVAEALLKTDQPILKLDAGSNETFQRINKPRIDISLEKIVDAMLPFKNKAIIQTLFLKGNHKEQIIDNTTEKEIFSWLDHIKRIHPRKVMIYPIARATPEKNLHVVPHDRLETIARQVRALGIEAEVY